VVPEARGNRNGVYTFARARLAVKLGGVLVAGSEVFANCRIDAGQPAAPAKGRHVLAGQTIHVGGGAAEVGNVTGKAGHFIANLFYLAQNRFLRTALNNAAFVFGNGTESTTAK